MFVRATPAAGRVISTNTAAVASRLATSARTAIRCYLGSAGDGVQQLSEHEAALYKVAKPRSDEILRQHQSLPDLATIPKHSLGTSKEITEEMALDIRRKRLVYRSKQRGWLEVDLLLGTWASENVPNLNAKELDDFEAFVNTETIDIYKKVKADAKLI